MRLLSEADQVAEMTPMRTNGFQKVNWTMYIQSWCRRTRLQVSAVRRDRDMKVMKVKAQADRVPIGILLPGDTNSPADKKRGCEEDSTGRFRGVIPERLAPDMMPVTPENKTPKIPKIAI